MTVSKMEESDGTEIVRLIKTHVKESELLTHVAGEMSFRLPVCVALFEITLSTVGCDSGDR
jgi:hypothetical protein